MKEMLTRKLSLLIAVLGLSIMTLSAQDEIERVDAIINAVTPRGDITWGEDSAKTAMKYSLYREYYKQKNYKEAIKHWRYVYMKAPAVRQTTHLNGLVMYKKLIEAAADDAAKEPLIDTLLSIYGVRINLFDVSSDVYVREAFDWYKLRGSNVPHLFNKFDQAFEKAGNETSPAFFAPYLVLAVKMHKQEKQIEEDKVYDVYDGIMEAVSTGFQDTTRRDQWGKLKGAEEKVNGMMLKYGYFECDKLVPLAQSKYEADKSDVTTMKKMYNLLKGGECYDDPFFLELAIALNELEPNAPRSRFIASKLAGDGKYAEAIEYFKLAIELGVDEDAKADDNMSIAKMYQLLGNFSQSRSFAEKAASLRSGWGEPYILIGKLYASSGKRCGPGTGWDSQVVTWPAIDMFEKARSVSDDQEVKNEAQALINKYSGFMPETGDCFFKNLKAGDSYYVECWIQRSTTVRCK